MDQDFAQIETIAIQLHISAGLLNWCACTREERNRWRRRAADILTEAKREYAYKDCVGGWNE